MAIRTTCIGAYPKSEYLHSANWRESELRSETSPDSRGFDYSVDSSSHRVRSYWTAPRDKLFRTRWPVVLTFPRMGSNGGVTISITIADSYKELTFET